MTDIKMCRRMETHSHSHYSNLRLVDSINRPKDMILTAYKLGLNGLCITDHEALCGHVEFLQLEEKLKKDGKIPEDFKIGLGNEIYLVNDRKKSQRYFHFILIAKDDIGHRQLRELSSQSWYHSYYDRGMERVPTLKSELSNIIGADKGHIIATSACLGGELPMLVANLVKAEKNKNEDEIYNAKFEIVDFLKYCTDLFEKDFYIEIAPSTSKEQVSFNKRIKDIAKALNIKLILATDAHYLTAKDKPMHKAYLNSKDGEREIDDFYSFAHMMDNEEAFENLYPYYNESEFESLCATTVEISDKIGKYNLFRNPIIPQVEVKDYPKSLSYFGVNNSFRDELDGNWKTIKSLFLSDNTQERYWINQCFEGLINKDLFNEEYISRIETEADIIRTIGEKLENCLFAYFNTFQHYIDLFWECGSLSGPGRGSSVCFLSNYLLGITQLDPIKWGLMEWRFLNKERVELPDIDTDLSPSKRALVFKRIRAERGELRLIQVSTFGTEGTRSAILTSCRGYRGKILDNGEFEYPNGIDIDVGQYMTGLIPSERGFLWPLEEVIHGNEDKDRKPIRAFIEEVNKYEGLLDIMLSIEGLVNKRSQHASGVILYNNSPFETNAIMRSPNGDLVTQFALHESEALGDTKFDFLVTEICDKITNAIELLKKDGYFKECNSLREIYEKYLHPEMLNLDDSRIWSALAEGNVLDVFQFNSDVGLQAAKQVKAKNPLEMTAANAMMRLMGEKEKERPLDRYTRLKNNIREWYEEMDTRGLSKEEQKILEKYYLPRYGVPAMQEDLMLVCMDKNIAHFTLKEANNARKVVAKKKMDQIPELKQQFLSQCPNHNFGEYVWETTMGPQMGYSFALPHSLAYSFVGIQTLVLATTYPGIYWNCACLITNSGGNEDAEDDENGEESERISENCLSEFFGVSEDYDSEDDDDEEDEEESEGTPERKKKKQRVTNYGKISTAIGTMQHAGISVSSPDINKSSFTFIPDVENDTIIYGIKGINRIGNELVNEIINNRPYNSIEDFLSKVKVNKPQMVSLIKSGAFDKFGESRKHVMYHYINLITEKKKRLTLQNMAMLIDYNLLPESLSFEIKVFNFNKYLKKCKEEDNYYLDEIAFKFYEENFDMDLLWYEKEKYFITQKDWDKIYKKQMDSVREYIKSKTNLLDTLNNKLFQDNWDKYCSGNISKWEMDSISFYYHDHELINVDENEYDIKDFTELPENPDIDRIIYMNGREIPLFKLCRIAGTVLDKNKNKNSLTVLTNYGVVNVKVYQSQFAKYDKQISRKLPDGRKKIVEKSWFSRGNKIMITGIKRGDNFIPKIYKSSIYKEPFDLINEVLDNGELVLVRSRAEEE